MNDQLYNMLERIKDVSNKINSTNCHVHRVEIREIANKMQELLIQNI